jgi:hypothetical protein
MIRFSISLFPTFFDTLADLTITIELEKVLISVRNKFPEITTSMDKSLNYLTIISYEKSKRRAMLCYDIFLSKV